MSQFGVLMLAAVWILYVCLESDVYRTLTLLKRRFLARIVHTG